jgi:hypothetical protein
MREPPQWYQISTSRLARERTTLAALPYFALEHADSGATVSTFTAVGKLHYIGARSGMIHSMRVRLEYPRDFPKGAQWVFDHDKIFKPCADGHLLCTHEMCLTLSERGEFAVGTEGLTEEVLGASLIWFHKRQLYERTGRWPGQAERHGIAALIDLLVERSVAPDFMTFSSWLAKYAATPDGRLKEPNLYAPCPCGNGKSLKFCHRDDLQLVFRKLAQMPAGCLLTDILDTKGRTI